MAKESNPESELGAEIRAARKGQRLTQDEVAESAGVSVRTVRNLEAGKPVTPGTISLVLRVLGMEPAAPVFPDEVAFIGNAIMFRLVALPVERRADLAARITRLLVEDAAADTHAARNG